GCGPLGAGGRRACKGRRVPWRDRGRRPRRRLSLRHPRPRGLSLGEPERRPLMTSVRVKLTFPEHLVRQPLLARMVREFDVMPNIRRANVEEHFGWIVCEIGGDNDAIERAIAWLETAGVQVDRLGDVVES